MLRSVLRATFTVLLRFRPVTFPLLPSPTLRSAHRPCTAPPHTPRGRARSLVLWSGRVQLDRRLLAPALDAWLRVEVRAAHHAEVDAVIERARTQRRRARRWRHVVFEKASPPAAPRRRTWAAPLATAGARPAAARPASPSTWACRRSPACPPSRNTWRGNPTPVCSRRRRPRSKGRLLGEAKAAQRVGRAVRLWGGGATHRREQPSSRAR